MPDKSEIESLEIDDLLRDLEGRAQPEPSLIELWIVSQGYHPGTNRIKATDLLDIFTDWVKVRPEFAGRAIPGASQFGIEMGRRFKRVKGKHGNYYLISRKKDPHIPRNLAKGVVKESGGGGDPVPPPDPKPKR